MHGERELLQGLDGLALAVGEAQPVVGDTSRLFDHQFVAEQRRPPELAHQRFGELVERVAEDDDLRLRTQLLEEVDGAFERRQRRDHVLDVGEAQAVTIEDLDAAAHQLVVVGFVAGGAPQFGDSRLVGERNPHLGHEDAFEIQANDTGHLLLP